MDTKKAEAFKHDQGFDRQLMCFIFPDGHPSRERPDFEDQLELNIKNQIDPCFTEFLASAVLKVPTCVYAEKPVKVPNPFRPTDQFRAFIRTFMQAFLAQSGLPADRKAVRKAEAQAVATLTDLINRKALVRIR